MERWRLLNRGEWEDVTIVCIVLFSGCLLCFGVATLAGSSTAPKTREAQEHHSQYPEYTQLHLHPTPRVLPYTTPNSTTV